MQVALFEFRCYNKKNIFQKGPKNMPDKKNKRLPTTFFDLTVHFVSTILLALFFLKATGGWVWPVLSIVGGILIDTDHLIDHFRHYGLKFKTKDFFNHGYLESGKCYVLFHSWELVIFLWILSYWVIGVTPLVTGMTLHMLIDFMISKRTNPMFFSLYYRWKHRFDVKVIMPERYRKLK